MRTTSRTTRRGDLSARSGKGGPKSAEGKAASSRNALKGGFTSQKLHLSHENPEKIREQVISSFDGYRLSTPLHFDLIDRIVAARLNRDRLDRSYTARLDEQIRTAHADIDRAMEQEVEDHKLQLRAQPARAVAGLRQSSLGCSWLVSRWQYLGQVLHDHGFFAQGHYFELARLSGLDPNIATSHDAELMELVMHIALLLPEPDLADNLWLAWTDGMPFELAKLLHKRWGNAQDNAAWIQARIDGSIGDLTARAEMLRTGREAAARTAAEDKALMLHDDKKAALWLRYSKETNSEFYRALKELRELLEQEAEDEEETESDESSQNELNEGAAASSRNELNEGAATSSRNELTEPAESLLLDDCQQVYDASDEVDSEPGSEPEEEAIAAPVAAAQKPSAAVAVAAFKRAACAADSAPSESTPAAAPAPGDGVAPSPHQIPVRDISQGEGFSELQRLRR